MSGGFVIGVLAVLVVVALLVVASGVGRRLHVMQPPPFDHDGEAHARGELYPPPSTVDAASRRAPTAL